MEGAVVSHRSLLKVFAEEAERGQHRRLCLGHGMHTGTMPGIQEDLRPLQRSLNREIYSGLGLPIETRLACPSCESIVFGVKLQGLVTLRREECQL